jgi:hypothetical protein
MGWIQLEQGGKMDFLKSKMFVYLKIILWLALIIFVQWPPSASAFKSFSSGEFFHKTITHQGLKGISTDVGQKTIVFSDAAILEVLKAVRELDGEDLLNSLGNSEAEDGEEHCDNERLLACSARILKLRKDIGDILKSQPLPENAGRIARVTLGKALHTVQDYYSHANWVERGNDTQINAYLLGDGGKAGGLLPPTELPPEPNANVPAACSPVAGGGSAVLNLSSYPTSGFWLQGNICDVSPAHPGRCVHGCTGPLCEQIPNSTCAGMNKDTPNELGGHSAGRHQLAANLAIAATTEFVNQIIDELRGQQGISQAQQDQALCALMDSSACTSTLPIIPGLVGIGVETPAGSGPNRSGGAIIHVTNLNDSGSGSLRAALEASGPRIVVFDVSGYISLASKIQIFNPYLTIAGQTAPFPGITLINSGLEIRTNDILIQHIRIRIGDNPNISPSDRDGITMKGVRNVVIDHVSVSWGTDENMGAFGKSQPIDNVIVANCIISEALDDSINTKGPHSMGLLAGPRANNFLALGNLFAHNSQRNMRVHGDSNTLFVNNVVYNWRSFSGAYGSNYGSLDASAVGNVYIRGVDTIQGDLPIIVNAIVAGSRIYLEDNQAVEMTSDPWSIAKNTTGVQVRVNTSPNWIPSFQAKKSNVVKKWVLNHAGARRADGDSVDARVIKEVLNSTGRIIDSQNDVGGWPPLVSNVRGTGGTPALSIPSNAIQPSGYTKVEEWLHLLARQVEAPL